MAEDKNSIQQVSKSQLLHWEAPSSTTILIEAKLEMEQEKIVTNYFSSSNPLCGWRATFTFQFSSVFEKQLEWEEFLKGAVIKVKS